MEENLIKIPPNDNNREDAWLDEALRIHQEVESMSQCLGAPEPASEAFVRRCREAARVAWSIRTLGWEHKQVGFVPLPLAQYVRQLARAAAIPLNSVLGWLQTSEPSTSTDNDGSTALWARLAREVGLKPHQVWMHARIGFAERLGLVSSSTLLARCRSAEAQQISPTQECKHILREIESGYDVEQKDELEQLRVVVYSAFWPESSLPGGTPSKDGSSANGPSKVG
jgi:hypothetical protein